MLLRGTTIVSTLTLLSRLLGFARDLLIAFLLGSSLFADAFFVAFRIPNLLRSFLAEGALTAAFTPIFASANKAGPDSARTTLKNVSAFLLTITIPVVLCLIYFAPSIVGIFAPGFNEDQSTFDLCVQLTQIMAPYIIFVSLIAMINAALNTLGIFGTSALAQIIMNIVLILGGLCALCIENEHYITYILALSVILGGSAQIIFQLPTCYRKGLSIFPSFAGGARAIREVVRLMLPATLGASVYQITIFFGTLMASLLPTGSVSWLFYADRIAQFPMGIFSIALASVLLPTLSNAAASSDQESFNRNLSNSLRYTSYCIIPVSFALVLFALPITRLLFQRGEFTTTATIQTSRALQALALGLWASSSHSMLVRGFIARKNTKIPTYIGICTLLVTVAVALLTIGPISVSPASTALVICLSEVQSQLFELVSVQFSLGHVGLAVASSCAALFSLMITIIIFSRIIPSFSWRPILRSTLLSLLCACLSALLVSKMNLSDYHDAVHLIMGGLIGGLAYGATTFLLGAAEARELISVALQICRRKSRKQ